MGCLTSSSKGRETLDLTKRQGASELKQNYEINDNTKVLGSGAFGKVYLSHMLKNKSK